MDVKKPHPPLYMPAWRGKIAEGELNDLVDYLKSLLPAGEIVEFLGRGDETLICFCILPSSERVAATF